MGDTANVTPVYNTGNDTASGLTYQTYKTIRYAIDFYLAPIFVILGRFANILSFIVLGRDKNLKKSAGILLRGLAVADTFFLVTYMPYKIWDWIQPFDYDNIGSCLLAICSTAQTITVWMVFAVTADRYIAICKPFYAVQYSTTSRARKTVVGVWILAFIYNFPRFFEASFLNDYILMILYHIVYSGVMYLLFRILIPLAGLVFFNVRLTQAVFNSRRKHPHPRQTVKEGHNVAMVIAMVTVFIFSGIPIIAGIIWGFISETSIFSWNRANLYKYILIIAFGDFGLLLNSSTNFILYYFLGERFRFTLWEMVWKKFIRRELSENTQEPCVENLPATI